MLAVDRDPVVEFVKFALFGNRQIISRFSMSYSGSNEQMNEALVPATSFGGS